ncbi:MAG: polysaccharide pyruvyl transferase family protein [Kiritimatiellia bacterium]|nr:polysaccharide pyruvyl transferase family protein [Kiritimatiellia bacterium]
MNMENITLLGSSSGRNSGDAALMAAIMNDVDRACGRRLRYDIPTLRPDYVRDHYPNRTRPVGMMPWHGAIRMLGLPTARSLLRTDAVILFDAVLFDRDLFNPLFNFMSSLYLLLPLAARRGIPIIGYNVGIGPIHTRAGRHMLRSIAESMRFITVRDSDSLELLREAGVRNPRIRLTADAALNAPAWEDSLVDPILESVGLKPGEPLLGININRYLDTWASPGRVSMGREAFLSTYARALSEVIERIRVPVVLVTTQHHDVEISEELIRRLPGGARTALIDNRKVDHAAIKGVLRRLSLLCGMRLHSLILASSERTPVIGLTYQPKVAYYFRELGLPEQTLSFDEFRPDTLRDHILQGWEKREALREVLNMRIPVLQAKAGLSAKWMAALDRGEWSESMVSEPETRFP